MYKKLVLMVLLSPVWVNECGSEHCSAVLYVKNSGAITEETGAFIGLSSVHLVSITGLSLYSHFCVNSFACGSWRVLASRSHVLAFSALDKLQLVFIFFKFPCKVSHTKNVNLGFFLIGI